MKCVSKEDLEKLPHTFQVAFACFCARQVLHLVPQDNYSVALKAIETAESFVAGSATKEECNAAAAHAAHAAHAAYAAAAAAHAAHAAHAAYAAAAANAAANAAAHAAHAAHAAYAAAAYAAYAAYAAAEILRRQWDHYNELLNFSETFEKVVLG